MKTSKDEHPWTPFIGMLTFLVLLLTFSATLSLCYLVSVFSRCTCYWLNYSPSWLNYSPSYTQYCTNTVWQHCWIDGTCRCLRELWGGRCCWVAGEPLCATCVSTPSMMVTARLWRYVNSCHHQSNHFLIQRCASCDLISLFSAGLLFCPGILCRNFCRLVCQESTFSRAHVHIGRTRESSLQGC